ncbi:hypothetical protein BPA01_01300 [Brevibacillus parabrevis]|uniref:Uncharacterized protein n=1 Tax=Brevibacillus parabrevis TaxID=54914 RepID=A0A4Y3P7X5_BREPA|nr:hypothetical protein BPA01_01300 [Brevibacillus parabrevis]
MKNSTWKTTASDMRRGKPEGEGVGTSPRYHCENKQIQVQCWNAQKGPRFAKLPRYQN